ncbi:hypothetical protein BP6252_01027 [Coleophoma cylindrospora]|uniref:GPI mannosyltransferase 2 n=1 Tax=Coleophoma cylindrospora TaxID=1849047 RepID=A0A3D8SRQ8_9HELO|nr:hypothetical protein BP6252_01027 [Coleophoma cylindrospora]
MPSWAPYLESPYGSLLKAFLAWKILLLVVAVTSPGPGYDTSSSLFLADSPAQQDLPSLPLDHLIGKLTRWDAIYFVKAANRGYLYEQEWAFGWGFSRLIASCTAGLKWAGLPPFEGVEAIVGVCIAHISHLLSVLALFGLTQTLFPGYNRRRFAISTAILQIISPAGLFLSAPYAESTCAFLSFLGSLLFAKSFAVKKAPSLGHDLLILAAGVVFGVCSTFRSNGILNGILLLEEAFRVLGRLTTDLNFAACRRLVLTGLGGLCVGVGFLIPQYIAYREFCSFPDPIAVRPWCEKTLPSIYTFVQEHYWNCGFLRYWTVSNIPLFLLATPMFTALFVSGVWGLRKEKTSVHRYSKNGAEKDKAPTEEDSIPTATLVQNMAFSQLILATLTLTGAHAQIITRVASAYPVWMWYIADSSAKMKVETFVRFMVIYALVQGGLFASFLPPA